MAIDTGSIYALRNYGSGKYLNIYNTGSVGNGTNVVQWSFDGSPEQKWYLQAGSSSGTYNLCSLLNTDFVLDAYAPSRPIISGANADIWQNDDPQAQNLRITAVGSGRYKISLASYSTLALTARGTLNGSSGGTSSSSEGNVYWSTFSSSNKNQLWVMEELSADRHSPPAAGLYNLVNGNGVNLNVYAGRDQNGTAVVMWENDGSLDQQFVLSNMNGRSKLFARCSSDGNGRVLDAYRPGDAVTNGARAQIWDNNDPVSQEMVISSIGSNYYKISLKSNNALALTASSASNNASVAFSSYNGATSQKWRFAKVDPDANGAQDTHNPPSNGTYNIVSSNGAYLNVYAGRDANLTAIVMWESDGSVDQMFRLGTYGTGSKLYAMCSSGGNGRVIDAYRSSSSVANGAKAQIYDSNDDISQILTITPKGNGLYKLALNSNKTLALTASGSANNSAVTFSTFTGAAGQLWKLNIVTPIDISTHQPPSDGVYNLINSNGAYLNIYAGADANGTKAVMWAADGSADQKFRLSNGNGCSRLYAMCSYGGASRVLDAYRPGEYVQNGAAAQIWSPNDDTAQLLRISKVGDKYKVALQSNTSLALTATGSANNSAATYTTYIGAANQLWTLSRVSDWTGEPIPDSFSIDVNHTDNCYPDRFGFKPLAWVCHIAEGTYNGTISWIKNPDSQVSSNYVISKDGRITEMVPVDKGAWCNGTSISASSNVYWGYSTSDIVLQNKSNANYYTISIEFEGFWNETKGAITKAQIKAAAWLMQYVRRIHKVNIPFDRDHILGHYQINPKTKPNCPGQSFQFDDLLRELGSEQNDDGSWDENHNPSTGGSQISYFNLYFIKQGGNYLTVDDGIASKQPVVNPDFIGNGLHMEDSLLPYDHSLDKHNIRQLFRLFPNGFIKPACSDRGISKYTLGYQSGDLKLMEAERDSTYQNYNLFYIFDDASEMFKISRLLTGNREYRLQTNGTNLAFTESVSDTNSLSNVQKWELIPIDESNNDAGLSYFDEYESMYSYYTPAMNTVNEAAVLSIKVSGAPSGCDRFHPYSNMRTGNLTSLMNCIKDPNIPVNDYNPHANMKTIPDIVKKFYYHVFAGSEQDTTVTTGNYLKNLFGNYYSIYGFHMGVDMDYGGRGTLITCAHTGIVLSVEREHADSTTDFSTTGHGTVSIYDTAKNVTYFYLHFDEIFVKPGDEVEPTTVLGKEGDTGAEPSVHLHFEVKLGECYDTTGNPYMSSAEIYPMSTSLNPYLYMLI